MIRFPHLCLTIIIYIWIASQVVQSQVITFDKIPGHVPLTARNKPPVCIVVAANELDGAIRAAGDLALDFGRVIGTNATVISNVTVSLSGTLLDNDIQRISYCHGMIIIGTIGSSSIIDQLATTHKIDISKTKGKWESYVQKVVRKPISGISQALVIAGSDKRGTIYGIYDISETMGVSPWHWWADVPTKTKDSIYLDPSHTKIQGPPSVKYRGIFINDEDDLRAWAKGRFPRSPRGGYLTSSFYELVFELLLRLKANYIWPAMKTTAAFYLDDPLNGKAANMYGIIVGTSHHEPMARSYNVQLELLGGPWDWKENRDNVTNFMRDGAIRAKDWETMYTMGMRGDGDRESPTLTAPQLEDIIQVQQDMLQNVTEKRLDDLPQIWALYKEVGQYWQAGMNVSELITMMWTDDNFGNLLRVPLTNETDRLGGAGVYYHFGYVGKPWHYTWINTIQLVKTWEQMHIAYEKGAMQIWICNSQDLKPYEVPTNHFLDMAYDMSRFTTPDSTTEWLKRWSAREFGGGIASDVAKIYNDYGRMVIRRKYESLSISPFAFSVLNYDEALNVQQEWQDLLALTQSAHDRLNDAVNDTFFELVLAPVMAGKNVFDLYINTALGKLYQSQRRTSTNTLASKARANFGNDAAIIIRYNQLFNNKWAWITSHTHIGFPGLDEPKSNIMPTLAYVDDTMIHDSGIMGVAVQGSNISVHEGGTITLRSMDPYLPLSEKRWIDVFTRANGTFTYQIRPNVSFVSSTTPSGQLTSPGSNSDIRSHISVNWAKAPKGHSWVALNIFQTDNDTALVTTALLPINKRSVPPTFRGFVESNGAISIEPVHWTKSDRKNGVSYIEVPHYGRTLSGVKLWPVTATSQTPLTGPKLTYNFYAFSSTPEAKLIVFLGGSLNYDPTRPLKLAYSVDSGPVTTKQVLPDYVAGALPTGWDSSVINGGWNTTSTLAVQEGAHTLNLWLLEPGVVLQKIILDFGGLKHSLLGPPESKLIH